MYIYNYVAYYARSNMLVHAYIQGCTLDNILILLGHMRDVVCAFGLKSMNRQDRLVALGIIPLHHDVMPRWPGDRA